MSFNIGENVGPYRIIEQLGQGGMATVYKAYHASLDRYVALKVLHQAFNQDQTFTSRFQREARVVAKLEHPNIVPIYDYSEHEARPYLVMKYIEGDTLKARLHQGPLTSTEIEDVVNSIGAALAYAHRQGILHRDIKPSNVMIAKDGIMYLADFGLARIAQAGESTMSSDSIMGTPQYISPEQAMGKKELDAGTDIYSFGVMLYEMVVGQVPFSADTPFSIIHDHIYTPLPLPMKVNPKVPEPVQRVLLKSLAKDRLDRYETVEEMMKAFKDAWMEAGVPMQGTSITMRTAALASEQPTIAKTQTSSPVNVAAPATRSPAKKRSPWMWVGIGIILLLCCMFAYVASRPKNPKTPDKATTVASIIPVTNLPPTAVQATLMPSNISPEVGAAQDMVNQNPSDPNAHLKLALALWDAKEMHAALDELAQAANLAGPNNKDFFLSAAMEFKKREAWVPTAEMYLRLNQSYRVKEMPIEIQNDFNEAIFKATEQKEMPLLFFERIDNADTPLGFVARGRYALFNGDINEAIMQLSNAEKLQPDMNEAALLRAEVEAKMGNKENARKILISLGSNPSVPEWIRIMADIYLKTIQ
ncbi:MAG: protein kinase [Chloroflexi bacterium]|nr:protein kinase [Chloroflexota bacterium]